MKAILASAAILIGCLLYSQTATAHEPARYAPHGGYGWPHTVYRGHHYGAPASVVLERYRYVPVRYVYSPHHPRYKRRHHWRGRHFAPRGSYGKVHSRPAHIGVRVGF